MIKYKPVKELVVPKVAGTVWKENVRIADRYDKPGRFTAFCSYEWTSHAGISECAPQYLCANVPEMPFSSVDSAHPEDLWDWMDAQRKAGNKLLAISHNANLSDGHMYPSTSTASAGPSMLRGRRRAIATSG
jgi:hypothetical protein